MELSLAPIHEKNWRSPARRCKSNSGWRRSRSFFDCAFARGRKPRDASGSLARRSLFDRSQPSETREEADGRPGRIRPQSSAVSSNHHRCRLAGTSEVTLHLGCTRRTRRLPRPALGHGGLSSPTRQFPPSTTRIIPTRPSGATHTCSSWNAQTVAAYQFDTASNWLRRGESRLGLAALTLWSAGRSPIAFTPGGRRECRPHLLSSSRFPVLPTLRPAHTRPFPTAVPSDIGSNVESSVPNYEVHIIAQGTHPPLRTSSKGNRNDLYACRSSSRSELGPRSELLVTRLLRRKVAADARPVHPQSSAVFCGSRHSPRPEAEVTFISGVTADATVAATSFGAWMAIQPYPSISRPVRPVLFLHDQVGRPHVAARWNARRRHLSVRYRPELVGRRERRLGRGVGAVVGGSRDHVHARDGTDCRSYPL